MIVTVTPNPSLDRTLEIDRVERGAVLRARDGRVEPGGKGINVARALHAHGERVIAVMPAGGADGEHLLQLLHEERLTPVTIPIAGSVRTNVTIVEPDGTVTKVNAPGPTVTTRECDQLLAAVERTAAQGTAAQGTAARGTAARGTAARGTARPDEGPEADWIVGSGSLPPGAPSGWFAQLVGHAHAVGCRVAIDSSGQPLAAAVAAAPDLLKPNLEELEEVTDLRVRTIGDAVMAARLLLERGVGAVLASLGEHGALLIDHQDVLHGHAQVRAPRSSVGAGDSMLAGYLTAADQGTETALRAAVAFGAAAVALPGTQMPRPADLRPELVRIVHAPAHEQPLRPSRAPSRTPALAHGDDAI